MRSRSVVIAVASAVAGVTVLAQTSRQHLNPMIDLLAQKKAVFGLYAPAPPRGGGPGRGAAGAGDATAAPAPPVTPPTPLELAKQALGYTLSDYTFSGSMEGGLEARPAPEGQPARPAPIATYAEFVNGMKEAGALTKTPFPHFVQPLVVKTPKIAPNPAKAIENISKQLNLGVSTIMFVGVESTDEVKQGLAAMRFASKGGTRPEDVGTAPAYWGMSEADYRKKADLWPLNPDGELVNWTIVESKEGLAHVREIAAVKGIGVLWPGAGTLRGVFRDDPEGWEAAIQQVLAACKEFNVPCGYPANATDIETRMKQGFSVFVMNWGDAGFRAVEVGRKAAGR